MGGRLPRVGALLLACLALFGAATATAQGRAERWVAAWGTSQILAEGNTALPAEDMADATLRQVVRVHIAGSRLRVRFTNAFGAAPLRISSATIAYSADPASARIDAASLRPLTFGRKREATIPAAAEYWSDPVELPVRAGSDLAISIHLPQAPDRQTSHPGSRATSYLVRGYQVAAAVLAGAKTVDRWYQIAGIEVVVPRGSALVAFGDSITDGYGVKPNTNQRWTDHLSTRMRADPRLRDMAVVNAGIGGNRLLLDGTGTNALARFDRDVLAVPGVTHLLILEGVNDLGMLTRDAPANDAAHAALVEGMIGALRQMVARARARGIAVIGATILPYGGSAYYHPDARNEVDRHAVNAWIRAPGNFDAVVDFDAALRDPARPTHLRADLDSGDGLHPSIAGYKAMADAVPLALLRRR